MQECFEKIIEKLKEEEIGWFNFILVDKRFVDAKNAAYDKAIEIVKQVAEEYKDKEILDMAQVIADYAKAGLEELKRISNNGWIPCSERLPKYSGNYICTVNDYSETLELEFSTWDDSWTDEFYNLYDVIAWQPKPQPYQPKGDKNE